MERTPKWQMILHTVQDWCLLTASGCILTISLVHHFLPMFFRYELSILIFTAVIGLGIGFIWLYLDFTDFRKSYLAMLDKRDQNNIDEDKRGKKQDR